MDKYKIKLDNPMRYINNQGKEVEITEINMNGLFKLTAADMLAIEEEMTPQLKMLVNPEFTVEYALILAERCTGMDRNFLSGISMQNLFELKLIIKNFFLKTG